MLRRKTGPKTGTPTLREPAQSKCTWTFRKSHFIRKFTGKLPRPRLSPECGQTFCASLRSRHAHQDITGATLCGNLQGKCCDPAGSHKRDPHFSQEKFRGPDWAHNGVARACAVETHVKISEEPMLKFTGKMPQPSWIPQAGPHFVRACAIEMHINISQSRATLCGHLQENAATQIEPRTRAHILREPAQSKCMSRFHKGHFIRVKCRRPEWAPWSSTGPYSYRKNPSVWTRNWGSLALRRSMICLSS